jgi:hypothetical protein
MKSLFPSLLILLLLLCSSAHGGQQNLKQGDYKIFAYTLSNGGDDSNSGLSSAKSISFNTLYISPEAMNTVLNREGDSPNLSQINQDNYQSLAFKASYAPTSSITLHSAISLTDTIEKKALDYKDRVGWEVNLGLAYSFFNNFAYEVHFGYMDTGELFKESNTLTDVDNITIVTNKLTMSF